MRVRQAEAGDAPVWAAMRHALWPDADPRELAEEIPAILADPTQLWTWVVEDEAGRVGGFIEVQLRDMFDGSRVNPYPHLEALWIAPDLRRAGAARLLLEAVESRARAESHTMLGSDVVLDNAISQQWHEACGFVEEVRVVLYSKPL